MNRNKVNQRTHKTAIYTPRVGQAEMERRAYELVRLMPDSSVVDSWGVIASLRIEFKIGLDKARVLVAYAARRKRNELLQRQGRRD